MRTAICMSLERWNMRGCPQVTDACPLHMCICELRWWPDARHRYSVSPSSMHATTYVYTRAQVLALYICVHASTCAVVLYICVYASSACYYMCVYASTGAGISVPARAGRCRRALQALVDDGRRWQCHYTCLAKVYLYIIYSIYTYRPLQYE